jgi:CubicO group peptidase (beta-lactamase class C family)
MKKILLIGLMAASLAAAAQSPDLSPANIKKADSVVRTYFESIKGGAVALLAQYGKPVYKKAYGAANEELKVAMNTDHRLGIGSVSKQFAAVAILMLQQEGRLNYKDDIRKYLPAYNTYGKTITIEHILAHTSGIPSYTELYGFDTLQSKRVSIHKLVKFFERQPLLFEPGTDWSYSNSGYVLGALIVEKVSGQPFNDFLTKRIFEPLHMTNTFMGATDFALENKTAEYGNAVPAGKIKVEPRYDWYWAYGAGQIISTVDDMLKWDEALYEGKILSRENVALAHKSFMLPGGAPANYGLGWAVSRMGDKDFVQHGGSIGGYRAMAIRIPQDHLYLIILSNSGLTNSALVANRVISVLYNRPALLEKPGVQDAGGLEGVYESLSAGSRLQSNFSKRPAYFYIRSDSGKWFVTRTGGSRSELIAAGPDLYFLKGSPYQQWKVERQGGSISGIRVSALFGASGPERFNKRTTLPLPAPAAEVTVPAADLAQWAGTYEHPFGSRMQVQANANRLVLKNPVTGEETKLIPLGGNRFTVKNFDREYVFETNAKTKTTVFRFFNGSFEMVYRRVTELY